MNLGPRTRTYLAAEALLLMCGAVGETFEQEDPRPTRGVGGQEVPCVCVTTKHEVERRYQQH